MMISAINAMTMTPARAAWIFGGRNQKSEAGDPHSGKEALPWWIFAVVGGAVSAWLLAPSFGAWLNVPIPQDAGEAAPGGLKASLLGWGVYLASFLPGALAGGTLGWILIRPFNRILGYFFHGFNRFFERATELYGKTVGWCLRGSVIVLLIYVGLLGLTAFEFHHVPTGFVPIQDKGYLVTNIQLPDSASLERTIDVTDAVEKIALETPGVAHTVAIPGTSFVLNANASNYSNIFIILKPFHERRGPKLSGDAIAAELRGRVQREVPEARVLTFGPPAVRGLGNAGGFKYMVEATGDVNFDNLQARADNLAAQANKQPGLVGVFNSFRARTPQLYVDIDRTKVRTMGVALTDVFQALQSYLGRYYVNDFNRFGRTWQVNVQADDRFRIEIEAVRQLKVRNADGDMVPLGAVADIRESSGPVTITRYNMFPAATITGAWQPGISTGYVLDTMERLAKKELPRSMNAEWTELSYMQKQASVVQQFRDLRQNPFSAFVLGSVLVFFVLSGLYEGWSLPFAVILVVPMCVLCAITGVAVRGMDNNIFTQVGFVVLIGLACKNAILIVEFARDRQLEGASRFDAAVEAARVRLRPIVMTTAAFIHMVPPYFATGAGAEMRRSVGTAMLWGAFGVSLFGIFLTPVFYYVVRWLLERKQVGRKETIVPVPAVREVSKDRELVAAVPRTN
jgi:multidrug efflux pump